jgi:hypothetical protein
VWLDERPSYTLEYIFPYTFYVKCGFSLTDWQKFISKQRNSFPGRKKENLSSFSFKSSRISLFPTFKHTFFPQMCTSTEYSMHAQFCYVQNVLLTLKKDAGKKIILLILSCYFIQLRLLHTNTS